MMSVNEDLYINEFVINANELILHDMRYKVTH